MDSHVTLYISTHNQTKLKYFGKSTKYHSNEELQKYYHGSGLHWLRHLKKYGDDVNMVVFGTFLKSEVSKIALKFSKDNDIVESKDWANLIPENGLDGGDGFGGHQHSEESKLKISEASSGRNHSKETKKKISTSNKGKIRTEEQRLKNIENASNQIPWNKGKKGVQKMSKENRLKMSKLHKGSKRTEESKENMRIAARNRVQLEKECPHCGLVGKGSNMTRYHFNNCKDISL